LIAEREIIGIFVGLPQELKKIIDCAKPLAAQQDYIGLPGRPILYLVDCVVR
jgi:hypothetical protein